MPVQANFLVGAHGLLLIVALVETYGCPLKKEGGSNFAHTVNIDGGAIFFQNSCLVSEALVEGSGPQVVRVEDSGGADVEIWFGV